MYTINPWLIGALIFCATAIAIVAICCDYRVEQKSIDTKKDNDTNNGNNSNECRLSKKIIKIHRNYIAGFLGFAIIMLLTAQFGRSYNAIYNYLSFASTITSLVLSILAIFVTVHSSADLYKQFTRIDSATETVQNASDKIGKTLTAIQNTETELKDTSNWVNSLMNNIVEEIEKRLDARLKKTESTFSEQIQKQYVNTQSIQNDVKTNTIHDASSFLKRIPYKGLLALYACAKGIELKKEFVLYDIFQENELYYVGVLVTAIAAGYIDGIVVLHENHYDVRCTETALKSKDINDVFKEKAKGSTKAEEEINTINEFFKQL